MRITECFIAVIIMIFYYRIDNSPGLLVVFSRLLTFHVGLPYLLILLSIPNEIDLKKVLCLVHLLNWLAEDQVVR